MSGPDSGSGWAAGVSAVGGIKLAFPAVHGLLRSPRFSGAVARRRLAGLVKKSAAQAQGLRRSVVMQWLWCRRQ